MRENICSRTSQGEAWERVDLDIPLHCLGNGANVIQIVSQSKGMTPARDPGFDCDSGHTHRREEKALEPGWAAGPASGRFPCGKGPGESQGSWPVSAQGFPAGAGRTSARQLSANTIQWKNQDGGRFISPQHKRNPECCDVGTTFQTSGTELCASVP